MTGLDSFANRGGLSSSASSATGPQGGDAFRQSFGGLNVNEAPMWLQFAVVALIVVVVLLWFKQR